MQKIEIRSETCLGADAGVYVDGVLLECTREITINPIGPDGIITANVEIIVSSLDVVVSATGSSFITSMRGDVPIELSSQQGDVPDFTEAIATAKALETLRSMPGYVEPPKQNEDGSYSVPEGMPPLPPPK
jgi:hypothetical protein